MFIKKKKVLVKNGNRNKALIPFCREFYSPLSPKADTGYTYINISSIKTCLDLQMGNQPESIMRLIKRYRSSKAIEGYPPII